MKHFLITLIAICSLNAPAAYERKPVVSPKQKFNVLEISGYNDIYLDLQAGVDSQHLSLSIFENLTKYSEVSILVEDLKFCQRAENAKPATSAEVAQLIRNEVALMAKHLQTYVVDQVELQNILTEYDKMTADFEILFDQAKLSICEEQTFPDYSDGQINRIIRYDDRVLVYLQLTKLD